jgi:acyl-coenzyme A synthetase/AMP-(fatty) acid ligase
MNFRGNRVSVVSVEATVMQVSGILDARLKPDQHSEDAQCALRVIAQSDAHRDKLRREIIKVVTPKGLIREITFVESLERTRSGKPVRRDVIDLAVSLGGSTA